ncbi:unnamed protein product [Sphagnum tenellum]
MLLGLLRVRRSGPGGGGGSVTHVELSIHSAARPAGGSLSARRSQAHASRTWNITKNTCYSLHMSSLVVHSSLLARKVAQRNVAAALVARTVLVHAGQVLLAVPSADRSVGPRQISCARPEKGNTLKPPMSVRLSGTGWDICAHCSHRLSLLAKLRASAGPENGNASSIDVQRANDDPSST